MSKEEIQHKDVVKRLALVLVGIGCCWTIFSACFLMWRDYRHQNQLVEERFLLVEDLFLADISYYLEQDDWQWLETALSRIVQLPDIAFASLEAFQKPKKRSMGEAPSGAVYRKLLPIHAEPAMAKDEEPIGQLLLQLDIQPYIQVVKERFLFFCLLGGIQSLVFGGLVYLGIHHYFIRYLKQIAGFLQTAAMHHHNLQLDGPGYQTQNGLEEVVDGINKLRQSLWVKKQWSLQMNSTATELIDPERESIKLLEHKTSLLRILYHDLANPLAIIAGSIEILEMPDTSSEDRAKRSQAIRRAAQLIQEILNHVRYIDQIHSSKNQLKLVPVRLDEIFEKLQFLFADQLLKKNLQLKIVNQLPPGTKCLADPITLSHQVLDNLVSNAIKFSYPNGEIQIIARLDQEQRIHIQVIDSGIGIPRELLKNIFDPRIGKSRPGTKGEQGSGFGMSLVKTFVESYGGEVKVESQDARQHPDEHGSTFHVYLKSA